MCFTREEDISNHTMLFILPVEMSSFTFDARCGFYLTGFCVLLPVFNTHTIHVMVDSV